MFLADTLWKEYAICVCILIFKMMFIAFWTAVKRFQSKAFANPEDRGRKNVRADDRVERVRRVHQNDLENIPLFVFAGALFLQTNPPASAVYYFYTFTASRVLHTVSYLFAVQPFRAIFYMIGQLTVIGMCTQIIMYCLA